MRKPKLEILNYTPKSICYSMVELISEPTDR